jgi:malonyl-ACP decarboxylase
VAVTGIGVVCAIAHDPESFATALRRGDTGVRTDDDLAGRGFAAPIRDFKVARAIADVAGLPDSLRNRAVAMTARAPLPIQVAAVVGLQAWRGARLDVCPLPPDRLGVVVGGTNLTDRYAEQARFRYERNPVYLPASFALHGLDTDHVGTLSEILGVGGEGFTVGGASASGNLAIIHAARLVAAGVVDACLAVGALADLAGMQRRGYINVGAMAGYADGVMPGPPFDHHHRGFVAGEGSACLVVESPRSARARQAQVLAELAGCGVALDANRLAHPSEDGEVRAMRSALSRAGLPASQVGYVNAHGTGSRLGDRTEAAALDRVFDGVPGPPWVNSTKSMVGHCLSGAGAVEAVATVLQLRDGFVHPNVGLRHPIATRCRLVGVDGHPCRLVTALSNSFGFGGFNTSIVLTRPGRRRPGPSRRDIG